MVQSDAINDSYFIVERGTEDRQLIVRYSDGVQNQMPRTDIPVVRSALMVTPGVTTLRFDGNAQRYVVRHDGSRMDARMMTIVASKVEQSTHKPIRVQQPEVD